MASIVEIKPSPDKDGFCLHFGKSSPIWFAHEHHAIGHAREAYPEAEIVVFEGEGIVKRRYAPASER